MAELPATFGKDELVDWDWTQKQAEPNAYYQFLEQYPHSQFLSVALTQLDQLEHQFAWEETLAQNTVKAFLQYRESYPNGTYLEEAGNQIAVLIQKGGYVGDSPISEAEEQALAEASQQDQLQAYNHFLAHFPDSVYVGQVKERIQQLEKQLSREYEQIGEEVKAWQYADQEQSILAYRDFLRQFPKSRYANLAHLRLEKLETKLVQKVNLIHGEEESLPSGLHRVRIAEGARPDQVEKEKRDRQAIELIGLWLLGLGIFAGLSFAFARFLFPVVMIVGIYLGYFLFAQRKERLTRLEKNLYYSGIGLAALLLIAGTTWMFLHSPA